MSNSQVGTVYEKIIQQVIDASRNDFEEYGVDTVTVLEEMKQGWQERLSALKVAQFPWDPAPEQPRQPPTVPSNVKSENDASPAVAAPQPEQVNFPNIKSERGYEQPMSAYPPMPVNGYSGGFNEGIAQQRAHALVAQRLQQPGMHMSQQQMPPQSMPQQQVSQQQASPYTGQQRMMPQQGQQRPQQPMQQRPQQPGGLYNAQTDGSDGALEDWKAFLAARAAAADDGPDGRIAADNLMRIRVEAMMTDHDNGLGMTLSEMPKGKKRKAITRVRQELQAEASSSRSSDPQVARFDGEDAKEPEEDPDDAINSDLDDPEDDLDGANDSDDEMLDYMLCTYDKVQRVKNKWKCTLKDGILTTNKKEYLFHKATGEFEW